MTLLDGRPVGDGRVGPLYQRVRRSLRAIQSSSWRGHPGERRTWPNRPRIPRAKSCSRFPTDYPIKVVGRPSPEFRARIHADRHEARAGCRDRPYHANGSARTATFSPSPTPSSRESREQVVALAKRSGRGRGRVDGHLTSAPSADARAGPSAFTSHLLPTYNQRGTHAGPDACPVALPALCPSPSTRLPSAIRAFPSSTTFPWRSARASSSSCSAPAAAARAPCCAPSPA